METVTILILLSIIFTAFGETIIEYNFTLDNEGWEIVGNKANLDSSNKRQSFHDFCDHARYNIKDMSQYITGKDDLINVDYKLKDDKNLWYFKSPAIENVFLDQKKRYFISFTMTSFMGDFTKINTNVKDAAIIIQTDKGDVPIKFKEDYDGKTQKIMMPIEEKNQRVESIMILGDWTRGTEMIGLDDVKIISYE
jgi:hypothetical protein